MSDYELLLPLPAPRERLKPASHWRSTWVVSSLETLKARGYYDRYVALLPAERRDEIVFTVAGSWLPMEVARTHYLACDRLGLSAHEASEMGASSARRAQRSVLRVVTTLARGAGVTPWSMVPLLQRLWERAADGGGGAVHKVGPKDSIVEMVGCELFDIPYFRSAYAGVLLGLHRLFSAQAYVHDVTPKGTCAESAMRFQWV